MKVREGSIVRRSTKERKVARKLQQKEAEYYLEIIEGKLREPVLRFNKLTGEVSYYR